MVCVAFFYKCSGDKLQELFSFLVVNSLYCERKLRPVLTLGLRSLCPSGATPCRIVQTCVAGFFVACGRSYSFARYGVL